MKVRIGIAGIGKMGKVHARVLSEIDNFEFVGIYDINQEEAEAIAMNYDVRHFESLEKLLDEIDAVIVATPTTTHRDVALKAIERRKHLLIEKPLAENSAVAEEIYREAKNHGVKLMVGHVERFNPVVQELKQILSEMTPLIISINRVGPFPPRIKDTGIILDLGIHDIDILSYLLESEPDKISCFKSNFIGEFEDTAIISFKYKNCLAHIITNWLTPFKVRKIEVATETDYFVGDLINQKLTRFSKYTEEGSYIAWEIPIRYKEPIREELKEFYRSIIEDRDPIVDGLSAVRNIKIAEACLCEERTQ
jgi:predicted dehydrogenase